MRFHGASAPCLSDHAAGTTVRDFFSVLKSGKTIPPPYPSALRGMSPSLNPHIKPVSSMSQESAFISQRWPSEQPRVHYPWTSRKAGKREGVFELTEEGSPLGFPRDLLSLKCQCSMNLCTYGLLLPLNRINLDHSLWLMCLNSTSVLFRCLQGWFGPDLE